MTQTKTNLRSWITKHPTTQRRPPRGQRSRARHLLSVSGDIYDIWVPEQGWLPWLKALIWGVIQPLGAYNRTGFDVIYCYGIWPHSTARRRDWIVLSVAHLCVCQAGLMACWPQSSLGVFYFRHQWLSHHKNLNPSIRPVIICNTLNLIQPTASILLCIIRSDPATDRKSCVWSWRGKKKNVANFKCERPRHCCHRWQGAFITCSMSTPSRKCLSCRDDAGCFQQRCFTSLLRCSLPGDTETGELISMPLPEEL